MEELQNNDLRKKKNLKLTEWIKQYDESNNLADIENNEDIFDKNNFFYEEFLPNFNERLNISSSKDIYDYEHFFSKPIAHPIIDKDIYNENKKEIIIEDRNLKSKEGKRNHGRLMEYYAKKNKNN